MGGLKGVSACAGGLEDSLGGTLVVVGTLWCLRYGGWLEYGALREGSGG